MFNLSPKSPKTQFIKHLLLFFSTKSHPQSTTATATTTIDLLKLFRYSPSNIATIIQRCPKLLNNDPLKFIKPKLEFYHRKIGMAPATISLNPQMLYASLENRLLPNYNILDTLFNDDKKLAALLKKAPLVLKLDLEKVLLPRISALREYNVSEKTIRQMVFHHTRAFYPQTGKFEEAFEEIKRMGISPQQHSMFAHALGVFAQMPRRFWERNMVIYREFGWEEEQVLAAFVKSPCCMSISVEKLRKNLEFYKEKLDWGPQLLSVHSVLLSFSLEKRLLPRYLTWEVLRSKRLIESSSIHPYYFKMTKNDFLAKYVYKCMDEAPEVLELNKCSIVNFKEKKSSLLTNLAK